ncbi:MAG: hypothetical protein ACI8RZ_000645 [Myxococcota bacterium]|jgi:hypothetical protein
MQATSLLIVLENRLPAGEREEVFAAVAETAWRPTLKALHRAGSIQFALRLSGPVLDWLESCDPDYIAMLQEMIGRGQVEMLGGLHYDAVPHAIPQRDLHGQIALHQATVSRLLGVTPVGMTLPQSAWDGALPRALARTGIAYTFLDHRLLKAAGVDRPDGWYVAEREGQGLGVFGVDEAMCRLFPWGTPKRIALALREQALAGQQLVPVILPGEWLGYTPGSRRWCWHQKGWIPNFIRLMRSQASWLKTTLPATILERNRPSGRVYPVAGTSTSVALSSLSAEHARTMQRLLTAIQRGDDPVLTEASTWMLGPTWESTLTRHDAANRLHKYALRVSNELARLQKRVERKQVPREVYLTIQRNLYRGQEAAALSGDLQGGLRMGAIRHAAWAALTEADHAIRLLLGKIKPLHYKVMDLSCDGDESVVLTTPTSRMVIRPSAGGAISELMLWGVGNLVNTFSRQSEAWFADLEHGSQLPALIEPDLSESIEPPEVSVSTESAEEPDEVEPEEGGWPGPPPLPPIEGLTSVLLATDRHRRLCFMEHFLGPETTLANLIRGQFPQTGDFLDAPYQLIRAEREAGDDVFVTLARDGTVITGGQKRLVRIDKRYWMRSTDPTVGLEYRLANRYKEPIRTRFAVEMNFNIDSRTTSQRYITTGDRRRVGMHRVGQKEGVTKLALVWEDLGSKVEIRSSEPATLFFFPVYSPARTLQGYDRGFQGVCILLAWDVELWGSEKKRFDLSFAATRTSV